LPGFGQQGLHTDWLTRDPNEPFAVVTALGALDGFTNENGAPRVVPGSHLVPRPIPKAMQAPAAHHPREQLVLARAGSVVVFNGHLAHSGTRNRSRAPRRTLHSQWIALDRAQQAHSSATAVRGEMGAS
jgi:ectoine hydroxylase-related dioxygenase (phytanoyl-CoA dioxygenase family)